MAWALAVAPGLTMAGPTAAEPVTGADTLAENPSDLSITVYRAPDRSAGSFVLDALGGFALISESRTVHLPAGRSRLRFEGVADGIEPASAIVTGLPAGIIEKNRDGALLSPSTLLAATVDKPVTLLRTDKRTGKLSRLAGTLRSDAGGGVVFETAEGIESLRCSGLAETFSFAGVAELAAAPILSVQVHSGEPVTRTVTLSYLARGFDWAADYTATVSADGKTLDLGAWVTLANGNGVGFPSAHAQLVAGRVNRESGEVEPLDLGGPILAQCWPQGTTSDAPDILQVGFASRAAGEVEFLVAHKARSAAPMALQNITVTAARNVEQEQLGDLKLYRVPDHTTVAGRQSKQVRLLDRVGIPVTWVYGADVPAEQTQAPVAASRWLRTRNTYANHLGLPLPSGHMAVFADRAGERLLLNESGVRDLAIDEELEINVGEAPDVQVATSWADPVNRVVLSNAGAAAVRFELRLRIPEGARVVHADHSLSAKNGRPIFRLTLPAHETVTLRYQTQPIAE
jgi:hypothetical protein